VEVCFDITLFGKLLLEMTMRVMFKFILPVEKANEAFKDGALAKKLESIMNNLKPEGAYFAPLDGKRGGMIFFQSLEVVADRRSCRTVLLESQCRN
jgi:hypothetical protein